MTTGYSTPDYGPASLHRDDCHCPACVDVEIVAEDSEAIGRCAWIDARREETMQQAAKMADKLNDDYLLFQADQHEDWIAWQWSIGNLAL